MNGLIGQGSDPAFLNMVWVFFLASSVLVFIVGVGLALRSATIMRLFEMLNQWISVSQVIKQQSVPHFVEPVIVKRPILLGIFIVGGATASALIIRNFEVAVFAPLFMGHVPDNTAALLATCTKWLLVIGNTASILVGLLMLFLPQTLSDIESVADAWYSVRKRTQPVAQIHNTEVDQWVLANPTVSGIALIIMSLGLAVAVFTRL